jgi:hypothetical protein
MNVTIEYRQNWFDLAQIYFGAAEAAYVFCYANGKNISDIPVTGELNVVAVPVMNKRVVDFYKTETHPATCDVNDDTVDDGIFDETFDETFE